MIKTLENSTFVDIAPNNQITRQTERLVNERNQPREMLKSDLTMIAEVARDAYLPEELATYFFPNPRDRSQKLLELFKFRLTTQIQHTRLTANAPIGFFIAEPPHTHRKLFTMKEILLGLNLPFTLGLLAFLRILKFQNHMFKMRNKLMKSTHWYLDFIAVSPLHQGKGYGTRMLQHILDQADQEGFPIYLEAQNKHFVKLYTSLGFEIAEITTIPNINLKNYCMIRKPMPTT